MATVKSHANVMFNLLIELDGLHFEDIYVFSKLMHQPKYIFLEKLFSLIQYYAIIII